MRLRIRAVGRTPETIRDDRIEHVSFVHQAVHGRRDVGPGPHRPLLHARHSARRQAGFVLPVLLRLSRHEISALIHTMNSTPPPLPRRLTTGTQGYAKRRPWPALVFLAIGIAPAFVCLLLIYTTHYKSSSVDALLQKFFIADTTCALIGGFGIGITSARQ